MMSLPFIAGYEHDKKTRGITLLHEEIFSPHCISMGLCKKDVTPLLSHWSYVFLSLTHRYEVVVGYPEVAWKT